MEGKRRRVVLVPCQLQGHINPMLQLGTILHSMGFSITVAHTQFNSPHPSDNLDFVFLPFSDGLTDDDHKSSGDIIALLLALNTGCEVPLRESLAQFLTEQRQQTCDGDGVVCIIYDSLMYCSQAVATYLKLPSIVLYTSAATNFLVNHLFRGLYEDGRIPLQGNGWTFAYSSDGNNFKGWSNQYNHFGHLYKDQTHTHTEIPREMEQQRRRRVVLVPCPFQGHINPMLQLGTTLHSMGFSITVAHSQFNSPNPSHHPQFTFLPLSDGLSTHAHKSSADLIALVVTLNTKLEVSLRHCLAQTMMDDRQHQDGDQLACIIADSLMYCSQAVAAHLKLPNIVLRTSNATTWLAYREIPRLHHQGYIPLQDSMLQELVPEHHPLRFKDLPVPIMGSLEKGLQLLERGGNIGTSSAMIWNTMDFLEHSSLGKLQKLHKVPLFAVGPLHKIASASNTSLLEEDTSCITWLDKQAPNSVLYVSLGSLASPDEKGFVEMAWGLANSNQPFLWVVRAGSVPGSEWIELLPEGFEERVGDRGKIVKWAPQKEVLAHGAVGGFWSHCGWNSTLESICEGVPMICWPCFGDQKVNARYLSHVWRAGVELEHVLEREKIERAVRRLMADREGEEMRQRAMEMKEMADLCMSKGGSSCNALNDLAEFIVSF